MHKNLLFIGFFFWLFSCSNNKDKALIYFENAQDLYKTGDYIAARQALDTIKILFPKEFEVLQQSLQLSRRIEIKIQERNAVFCDSMLLIRQAEADSMKPDFLFEKNPDYDEKGKYIDKRQLLENRLQRSYIRSDVDESGEITLAGVYYGSQPIHHSRLKISNRNGEYVETQDIAYDGGMNYSFVDFGMTTEVVSYTEGKDSNVIKFIHDNKNQDLKAEYLGGKHYSLTISQGDKNALAKTLELSVILSDIERLKKEKEKAAKRLEYLRTQVN
ncbi:MAG: hypothetical protein LBT25_04650 [Candidatus Symbiothrix sp.]|jgi:hypothetical protein|nr:hypothetical protein [Candidatus Symbiothrix sp.]